MDHALEKALEALREKTKGEPLDDASVRLDFVDVGALRLDQQGARLCDGSEADCTITAELETFRALFEGNMSPTSAFMTGKLRIAGDMGVAMRVAGLLG